MAHADTLPADVLDALAAKVGTPLAEMGAFVRQARAAAELCETFAVWSLNPAAVLTPDADFTKLVRPTERWHHQIKVDGKAAAYARSMAVGTDAKNWEVTQLFQSDIPEKIDHAIDWVDRNVQDDPVVRLLLAPSYYLTAFWLSEAGNHQVYVIDVPSNFNHVRAGTRYSAKEFLQKMAHEQPASGFMP